MLVLPSEHLKVSLSLHAVYTLTNYKKNSTITQETSGRRHAATTTDKFPINDESINSIPIEYSKGEVEGPWPALHDITSTDDTSPITPHDIKMTQSYNDTYSSDHIVEESITVPLLMNSSS